MLQLACLAVLLLAQLPQQHVAQAADLPTQAAKPSIIAVGDGLTEGAFARKHDGWGVLLQERYVRKVGSREGRGPDMLSQSAVSRLWASYTQAGKQNKRSWLPHYWAPGSSSSTLVFQRQHQPATRA